MARMYGCGMWMAEAVYAYGYTFLYSHEKGR